MTRQSEGKRTTLSSLNAVSSSCVVFFCLTGSNSSFREIQVGELSGQPWLSHVKAQFAS